MKRLSLFTAIILTACTTTAQIINIPDDYTTIQEGIDAASNGDTVLVDTGTYVENINYNGKNITVASLYLTTLDTSYISQTIIDGSQAIDPDSASVVTFSDGVDSTAVFSGFTITNGTGTRITLGWSWNIYGGGLCILASNPKIKNVIIQGNSASVGGGIYCNFNSSPALQNVTIAENNASGYGGGLYAGDPLSMINCKILDNSALTGNGGGICSGNGNLDLAGCSVTGNIARNGGGVYFYSSNTIFEAVNQSNIYNNYALIGNDLYSETAIEIIIDTFSVLFPTEYHAAPIDSFSFNISNGKIEQADADLYVSPAGENTNSGLSVDEPLKNIRYAFSKILADETNPHTIHLKNGTYGPSANGEIYPLNIPNYVSLLGESEMGTILDGEWVAAVMRLVGNTGTKIQNLTVTNGQGGSESTGGSTAPYSWSGGITCHDYSNPVIENISVVGNSSGIYCTSSSSPTLDYITIEGNDGRGLYCKWGCNANVSNTTITGNAGSGIVCSASDPNLLNTTISDNTGSGLWCYNSSPVLKNIIITNNSAGNGGGMHLYANSNPSLENVTISYNSASSSGGGIYCVFGASPGLKDVTIKGNSASSGGGIYCDNSTVAFDHNNRCNIYLNNAVFGNDLYSNSDMEVVVDTFTVLSPSVLHANSFENFSFDILHGKIEQANADLYVSPFGDNSNNGLTVDEPLKTIHHAFLKIIADSLNPHSINLMNGMYSSSTNEELFPKIMQDYVSLNGESESGVILDAEGLSGVLMFDSAKETKISDVTITGGTGSGISIMNSDPEFQNITIKNNTATTGGGIYSLNSNPEITNVTLTGNSAIEAGGGIFCDHSNPVMENVSITENSSDQGGGIYFTESNPVFNGDNRCNIYLNNNLNNRSLGADIFAFQNNIIHVIVDTFTVLTPTDYYASPIDIFTFDILHSIHGNLINSDLYISVNGDNSNTGTSPDDPFKTINHALSRIYTDSLNHHTIHLLPGTYSSSTNGEKLPVTLSSYVSLEGSGEGETILDGDSLYGVMRLHSVTNSTISHLTIRNGYANDGAGIYCHESSPVFEHVTVTGNYAYDDGGGIFCHGSSPVFKHVTITGNNATNDGGGILIDESGSLLENVTIKHNTAGYGGGICCWDDPSPTLLNVTISDNIATGIYGSAGGGLSCKWGSNPILENVIITGNFSSYNGGGISSAYYSSPILKNVTISNNSATEFGGGIYLSWGSGASLINSILWNNSPQEVRFNGGFDPDTITLSWSDVEEGETGIVTNNNGTIYWLEGNIDDDPLFIGSGDHPFALLAASPCVDAGTPDTTGLFLPPYDIIGSPRIWNERIDMGAYEWNSLGEEEFGVSGLGSRVSCYPNPFSTLTTIAYELQQPSTVQITIYNYLGKQVEVIQQNQSSGKQQVVWNAEGLPGGIYFCVLKTHTGRQESGMNTVKMIKMK